MKPLVLTLLIAGSASALAGCMAPRQGTHGLPEADTLRRHLYAGVGIGRSRLEPDASEVPAYTVNDRDATGGQITLGIDINKYVSAELHSADLGSAGFDPSGRINYHTYGVTALLYAGGNRSSFRRQGLTGYGRVGYGYLENTPVGNVPFVKDHATHVLFGAGVEYMTRIGLGIRAEGIAYDEDAHYAQLGLIYRTGRRPQRQPVQTVETETPTPAPVPAPAVVAASPAPQPVHNACAGTVQGTDRITFHTDSAALTADARQLLDGVADDLAQCSTRSLAISAHTDSVGSESYNQALSERRAASILDYLESRGIDADRMSARGFGETQPVDTNSTKEGRQRNRRVELTTTP